MNSSGFSTVNPSTGEQIETFSFFNSRETEAVLARADKSFQSFRKLSLYRRAQLLTELAETLRKNKAELGEKLRSSIQRQLSKRLVCRERTADVGRCTRLYRRRRGIRFLSTAWADTCNHAVEFSDLA